jgi:hypothetical protein
MSSGSAMGKGGGTGHVPVELLDRYAAGQTAGGPEVWWAIEVHLESCAACRTRLGDAVARCSPATSLVLDRVRAGLATELARQEAHRPRVPLRTRVRRRVLGGRPVARWAAPALLPRLGMTVLVVLVAVGLDLLDEASVGRFPSLVLLLAPVAPLAGVAAAWSRGLDPAYELVVASPRAGLDLVVRRTAAVLAVVIPALGVAGWLVGASPAHWLLPCLAFTAGALALGEVIGLHRAATGLALGWVAVVVGPSLVMAQSPVVLSPASSPGWAVAAVAIAVLLVVRRGAYTGLPSGR